MMYSYGAATMKPYHMSYWKTIILALGCGGTLMGLAVMGMVFGPDLAAKFGGPSIVLLTVFGSISLLALAGLCFSVAAGGLLSLYRDITRGGRP